jgi:hypothetical protein
MSMRQNLAQFEQAFVEEIHADRERREALQRQVASRARQREITRTHKRGSMRFGLLVLVLVATAVLVTLAMFETLFLVMG